MKILTAESLNSDNFTFLINLLIEFVVIVFISSYH